MYLLWIIFILFVCRKGRLALYGICPPRHRTPPEYIVYIPTLLMPAINLCLTIRQPANDFSEAGRLVSPFLLIWNLLVTVCCSAGEELFFRGFLPSVLQRRYKVSFFNCTVITSFFFALMHIANLYSQVTLLYVLIQGLCAGAVGFCFAVIARSEHSILPCMIIHALINITSISVPEISTGKTIRLELSGFEAAAFSLSATVYLSYGIWLYRKNIEYNKETR